MRTVICVPWRGGDPHRERAWAWCRARWASYVDWPIVTADADPEQPFSRAGSKNAAARLAGDWDVAVFADADCILRYPPPLLRAVEVAAERGFAVLPHTSYHPLTESGTEAVYLARRLGWDMHAREKCWCLTCRPPTEGERRRPDSAIGGLIVIPRGLWDAVDGYDERFRGWGSEDGAMNQALRTLGSVERIEATLYQLWHQPSVGWYAEYQRNKPLRRRYAAAGDDPEAMRALVAERRQEVAA